MQQRHPRRRGGFCSTGDAGVPPPAIRGGAAHAGSRTRRAFTRAPRTPARSAAKASQHARQAGFQVLRRRALEARAGEALQAADDEGREHRGAHLRVDRRRGRRRRALRRHCLSEDSTLSKNWFMRCCRRSFSNTSASPTITRVMPGFFSANWISIATMRAAWAAPAGSRSAIWLIRVKTLCSMNSIRPSNICALLAKWRYSAASLTSSRAARAAVVMRSAPGCSSMVASACRICTRRSPGLGRLRATARRARRRRAWVRGCRARRADIGLEVSVLQLILAYRDRGVSCQLIRGSAGCSAE